MNKQTKQRKTKEMEDTPLSLEQLKTIFEIVYDHKLRMETDMKKVKTMMANDLLYSEVVHIQKILKNLEIKIERLQSIQKMNNENKLSSFVDKALEEKGEN